MWNIRAPSHDTENKLLPFGQAAHINGHRSMLARDQLNYTHEKKKLNGCAMSKQH